MLHTFVYLYVYKIDNKLYNLHNILLLLLLFSIIRFGSYRKYLPFKLIVYYTYITFPLLYSNMYFWQQYYEGKRVHGSNLIYENNAYRVRGRYVHIISTRMLTKIVCTVTVTAREIKLYLPPTPNVISASYTYQFPISVTGTYMLFLPRLYIIRILYVVAQASLRSVDKKPPVYTTPPVAACLTFLFAISTCHS